MSQELKRLDDVRTMCNSILAEYRAIPQAQLVPASRDIIAYARAAVNLCDAIELGHRDSAKDVAYRELDSLMSSMMDIKKRMDRRTKMETHEEDAKTNPQGFLPPSDPPPRPEETKESLEGKLAAIVKAVESLNMDDDKKIGILIGITLGYCKRAGKNLNEVIEAHQEVIAKTSTVLDNG